MLVYPNTFTQKHVLRSLKSLRIYNILNQNSPALIATGHHTCKSALLSQQRSLHGRCSALLKPASCIKIQTCNVRKIFPDPFPQDPEYFLPPQEKTHFDLEFVPELGNKGQEIVANIQEAATSDKLGRLFAVVHIGGKQRKITTEDMLIINGFFPPDIGDKIRLEKVMLVGGKDFTLFGRPLLDRNLVRVEATVIEKTLSHVKVDFYKRKRYRRLKLLQNPQSVIVINSIEVDPSAL